MNRTRRESPIEEIDVREVSRRAGRCETTVRLVGIGERTSWLRFGEASLRAPDARDRRWMLSAYLPSGVCDFDHSSAYLLRLPLIGVNLEFVDHHDTLVSGWIAADEEDEDDFRVPPAGYDPAGLPGAKRCEGVYDEARRLFCKWNDGVPHVIVPDGYYLPPNQPGLFAKLRGKRVEIYFRAVSAKDSR